MSSIRAALREAATSLDAVSITARFDSEWLMAHALGVSRSELLLRHLDDAVPGGFPRLLARRLTQEPMAYILGDQEFYGLPFMVGPQVLIPRQDSEVLVEQALACRPDARRVLDCGTGSGALLLAVLHHLPAASGVGIDRSQPALAVAEKNARALDLADRANFAMADWEEPGWADALGGPFDLVLANPPYVEDHAQLEPSVRNFEPAEALFAGADGLNAYRVLMPQISALLAPGGHALIEIGATQAPAVEHLGRQAGFAVNTHQDSANRPRVIHLSSEN